MRSSCLCVCVSLLLAFECLNQTSSNVVCISWHVSPPQRRTSEMPPINLCVCTLLCDGSKRTLPQHDTHAIIEELLDESFYMWSVSYQMSVCRSVYLLIVARQWLSKHVPAAAKN
jgi:hypothetical protein